MGGNGGGVTPAGQQYCLKWNNHQNNLLRVFSRLLGQEQFTDVVVAAEGRHVKCHKMILSACSSYFEQLFINFTEPNQIVILKDTSFLDIVAIVEFMYKGEINVSQDKLSSLLKTAENLKVKGLAEVSGEEGKGGQASATPRLPGVSPIVPRIGQSGPPPPMQMLGRPIIGSSGSLGLPTDPLTLNGDVKRKRGRPRTLDGPKDDNACFGPSRVNTVHSSSTSLPTSLLSQSLTSGVSLVNSQALSFNAAVAALNKAALTSQAMSPLQAALNRPLDTKVASPSPPVSAPSTPPLSTTPIKMEQFDSNYRATSNPSASYDMSSRIHMEPLNAPFVSSLTPEQVASWGIIKMNDYLVSGTRQQYWEEFFVKHVMSAVKNKEIDMKGAAELLGVSYGTLYGRYRETFGYLKHAWNVTGRPQKKTNLWTDPNTRQILESMRTGAINIKQAAEALGMEPAMLAYQLAGKVTSESLGQIKMADNNGGYGDEDPLPISYDDEDYNEEMMEVQPDIILEGQDHEPEQFDSIVEEEGVDPIQS